MKIVKIVIKSDHLIQVTNEYGESIAGSALSIDELKKRPLMPEDFGYEGAFILPASAKRASRWGYGGSVFAYNGESDSVFVSGHPNDGMVAEVSVPSDELLKPLIVPRKDSWGKDWDERRREALVLRSGSWLMDYFDPTGGLIDISAKAGSKFILNGLCHFRGQLHWSVNKFYNVEVGDYRSYGFTELAPKVSAKGLWHVGPRAKAAGWEWHSQKTAGYVLTVPRPFKKNRLACGAVISQGLSSTSFGPAYYEFSSEVPPEGEDILDAEWLMSYGTNSEVSSVKFDDFKACDKFDDAVWVQDTLLIVGRKSLGKERYGIGKVEEGDCTTSKGYHCSPYVPMVYFFHKDEIYGDKNPWEKVPYATWTPQELWYTCDGFLTGCDFDTKNLRFFLLQKDAWKRGQYETEPLIHVYKLAPLMAKLVAWESAG